MKCIGRDIAIILFLLSTLFLSGCIKEMARATGDAYKGMGGVISDYGNGKYEDKDAQSASDKKPESSVSPENQAYTDRDNILFVQTQLHKLNYDVGTPDGKYGPKTRSAVRAFQKNSNIPVSGMVDQITLNKLNDI